MDRMVIGSLELASLPELGLEDIEVRVDTGAKTSSLHVDNIRRISRQGKPWVEFELHPNIYNLSKTVTASAAVVDCRKIKSSNGSTEQRYVIKTAFCLGEMTWPIEITLTNRQDMSYLMLLGREGMGSRVYVDPSQAFLL